MSKSVDERVVQMQFDNKQFEQGAQQSLSTLDRLKQSLNLLGTGEALKNLETVDSTAIQKYGTEVEGIGSKFSALETIAVGALLRIGSQAVDAGAALVKSITIDQVSAGWDKYREKTEAMQTIMAATRKDFEDQETQMEAVNEQMDKLNWFTDETSYDFVQMASNIGKFTNNGIKLEEAVTSMQGIATWAGVSGATVQEASRAMYNFSQAMGVGYMGLQDWKSIENANMATMEFKEMLIDAALAAGTLTKEADGLIYTLEGTEVTASSLGQTLRDKWATKEVMTETLRLYGEFTDVLYESQMAMEDSFDSAGELLSAVDEYKAGTLDIKQIAEETGQSAEEVSEIFEKLASDEYELGRRAFAASQETKTFQEVLDYLKDSISSVWMNIFQHIFGDYLQAKELWTALTEELYETFVVPLENLEEIMAEWEEFGGNGFLIQSVQNLWGAVKDLLGAVGEAFKEIFPPITGERLADLTKKLRDFTETLRPSEAVLEKFKSTFKGVFAVVDIIGQVIGQVLNTISYLFTDTFGFLTRNLPGVGNSFLDAAAGIGEWLVNLDETLKKGNVLSTFFTNLLHPIDKFVLGIRKALFSITGMTLSEAFGKLKDSAQGALDKLKEIFGGFGSIDTGGIDSFSGKIKDKLSPLATLFDGIKSVLGGIWDFIKSLTPVFGAVATALGNIFSKIGTAISNFVGNADLSNIVNVVEGGTLVGIGVGISGFIKSLTGSAKSLTGILDNIKDIFGGVGGALEAWQNKLNAGALKELGIAIALITASVVVLSMVDPNKISTALMAITAEFGDLVGFVILLDKSLGPKGLKRMKKVGTTMIAMAAAVLILSIAMKKLADLDSGQIVRGVAAIAATSFILVKSIESLSKQEKKTKTSAVTLIAFAVAIKLLAGAVEKLGQLDLPTLAKGLAGVGALMLELAVFTKLAKLDGMGLGSGVGLLLMAASLKILAGVVKTIGELNPEEIAKGLGTILGLLLEISIFSQLMSKADHVVASAASMFIMAVALKILGSAIKDIGSLDIATLAKGLIAMGLGLAEVVVAMRLMPNNALSISAGMVLMGIALKLVAGAMKTMGGMSIWGIIKGLIALGGAMLIMAGGAKAMNTAVAGAAAMILMSLAIGMLVPPLMLLGMMPLWNIIKALLAIAGAFAVFGIAAALLTPVVPVMMLLAAALMLIGVSVLAVGAGLSLIGVGLSLIAASGMVAIMTLINGIKEFLKIIPEVAVAFIQGITTIVVELGKNAPAIVEAVVTICNSLLDGLLVLGPKLIDTVVTLLIDLLTKIKEKAPEILETVMDIVIELLEKLAEKVPEFIQAGIDILVGLIEGLAQGIEENKEEIKKAIDDLFQSLIDLVLELLGIGSPSKVFDEIGVNMIQGAIDGIKSMLADIKEAVGGVVSGAVEKAKSFVSNFLETGKSLVGGLLDGISSNASKVAEKISEVANGAINKGKEVFDINSPSKVFAWMGEMNDLGLAQGFLNNADVVENAASTTAKQAVDALGETLANAGDLVDNDLNFSPTVTPVLDLSNIQDGAGSITDLLNNSTLTTSGIRSIGGPVTNGQLLSALGSAGTNRPNSSFNFYITGGANATAEDIANEVMNRINVEYQRQRAVWA